MVHLDIENPGGRVLAVKGVPSHRQRIPSGGTPNLPTATANADLAQGEGEAGFSGAVVAHGGRPKKTHRSRAHHRASQPAGSADYTFQQSTIRRDKLRDLYHGLFLDKPWPECVGSERRGGSDEPYETGGDGEERPTILPGPAIVVKSAKGCCPHILSGLQAEICREEASPQNQFRAYDVDGRSATRERITEGLCTQHFNSESKSIEKDEGAGTLGVATEPAETLSRPMELTVLGEGSTECLREIPNEKRISVSSPQLNELRTERPSEQRDQADHPPSPEDSVGRDHKALPLPTRDRAGTGTKVSASTPEASYSLPRKDAQISRTQPPSLGFKPKKLRGKFDKRVIEGHLGIELSLERAQKLRIISGNAMSAAISLYLQGYCNVSEGQNPDACEAKDQCPELARHGGNRESGPSTATSQKKRPSENQLEIYPHESADGRASTVSTPSEDASINKPPTEEHAKGVCEEMALLLARTDEAENAKESHLPQDTSRPLVQHEMSREQAVLGRVEWQGDHEESSKNSSRGDFQATDADSNSTFSFDGIKHTNSGMTEANDEGAIPGAGPVPLRGMQGFTNQENVRPRNPPSNTSRLPNGKLGTSHRQLEN